MKAIIPTLVAVAAVAFWLAIRSRVQASRTLQRLPKMFSLACAIRCCGVHEPSLACLLQPEPTKSGAS
jgi:hypothetical protein